MFRQPPVNLDDFFAVDDNMNTKLQNKGFVPDFYDGNVFYYSKHYIDVAKIIENDKRSLFGRIKNYFNFGERGDSQ